MRIRTVLALSCVALTALCSMQLSGLDAPFMGALYEDRPPAVALLESTDYDDQVLLIEATRAVEAFLATDVVLVERMTKKGMRELDARAPVVALAATAAGEGSRLDLVLRHVVPAVRPDDVLTGLRSSAGLDTGTAPLLTRLAQGPLLEDGSIGDPLVASR